MANIIQFKRSTVAGKTPNVSDLEIGEIALNLNDGIIYSKNTAGYIIVVGSATTSNVEEGVNLYFTNTRAISAFTAGSGIDIESNGLITSTVTGGGGGVSVTVSDSPPSTPNEGDVWIDGNGKNLLYFNDGDTNQWVDFGNSATPKLVKGFVTLDSTLETVSSNSTAILGNVDIELHMGAVHYFTANAAGNFNFNIKWNSSNTLNSVMAVDKSLSVGIITTQGSPAYYSNSIIIDSVERSVDWPYGFAPTSGTTNSKEIYSYTIIKTGNDAFTVFGSTSSFS